MTQPTDDQEILHRTLRGIALWLRIGIGLFWLSLAGVLYAMVTVSSQLARLSYVGVLGGMLIILLSYLFVLLEPQAIADRRIKVLLAVSYGNFVLLSVLLAFPRAWPRLVLRAVLLAGGITLLTLALRRNHRVLFVLAFALLLLANLA